MFELGLGIMGGSRLIGGYGGAGVEREKFVALGSDIPYTRAQLAGTRARFYHKFIFEADTPYLRLAFPGWYLPDGAPDPGEYTLINSETPTVRAHLTIGSTCHTFTFAGGATSADLPDLQTLWTDNHLASDWGLENFAKGTTGYVYWEINFSGAGGYVPVTSATGSGFLSGERWYDGGTSSYMVAGSPATAGGSSQQRYTRPLAFVGLTNETAFIAFGDSIVHGKPDDYQGYGDQGGAWFYRALFAMGKPGCKLGLDGSHVYDHTDPAVMTNRLALVQYADVCLVCWGTNDLNGADTAQRLFFQAGLSTFRATIRAQKRDIFIAQEAVIPRTNATSDNYTTVAGQTTQSGFGATGPRADYLAYLVANVGTDNIDGYFDLSSAVWNAADHYKWTTDEVTVQYGTPDGTHPSARCYGFMAVPAQTYLATLLGTLSTPYPFTFVDKTEAALSGTYTSALIRVSGINTGVVASVTGGTFNINGGAFSGSSRTVYNGDEICARGVAPAGFGATTNVVVTIGGVSDTYSISTAASADDTPAAFSFTDQTAVNISTSTESNAILVTSINVAANISISGAGEYQIDGGSWTSTPGTVLDGSTVKVRITSSGSYETAVSTTLSIGGTYGSAVTDTFTVTTAPLWQFVGIWGDNTAPTGDVTIQEPAGVQNGDLLIAAIAYRDTPDFTYPAGWTDAATPFTGANTASDNTGIPSGLLAYQIRSGTPNLTFVRSAPGGVSQAYCVAYRKISGTPVLDTSSSNRLSSASTTVTTPTLTTSQDNVLLVAFAAQARNSSITNFKAATDPSTQSGGSTSSATPTSTQWLLRASAGTSSGAHVRGAVADAIKATAGATGTMQYTSSTGAKDGLLVGAFK